MAKQKKKQMNCCVVVCIYVQKALRSPNKRYSFTTSSLLSMDVVFTSFVRAENDNSGRDCQSSEQTNGHHLVNELCPVANKLRFLFVLRGIFINIRIVCFIFLKKDQRMLEVFVSHYSR